MTLSAFARSILCAFLLMAMPVRAQSLEVSATIRADRPGPTIHRYVFGQMLELVGRNVHDGVWVGPGSPIPNTRGFRNDVIAALRDLHVPIVRWPGGCYADVYNWRDGLGDPRRRPRRIAGIWGGTIETNAVGTHEFFDFIELIGAEAYINGNLGSAPPREMAEWLEYMTSDLDSALTRERRRNGRAAPWRVAVFGVGNETWGCGGNMRAEYAADQHNRYSTFLYAPPYPNVLREPSLRTLQPILVASGATNDGYEFTRTMMANATNMDALSLHYYTFPRGRFGLFGPALNFPEAEWASTIRNTLRMDELVTRHSAIMDAADPAKRVGLYVDEWGTWYDATPGESFAWQQSTVRDAVVAGLNLNIFMRHADRVRLTMVAQLANVLQSAILTRGRQMVLTPTYHVFRMYAPFQDATFVPIALETPAYVHGEIRFPAVDAVAARGRDGVLRVALVNAHPERPARLRARLEGASGGSAVGTVVTGARTDSHNDFGRAPEVTPTPLAGRFEGGTLTVELPARSVAVLELR